MKQCKKWIKNVFLMCVVLCFFSLFFCVKVWAADYSELSIQQQTDQQEIEKGETVSLSVVAVGDAALNATKIQGEIEYDTDIFTVLGVESEGMSLEYLKSDGFRLEGSHEVSNGNVFIKIRLKVNADVADGKTTVCVGSLSLQDESGQTYAVSNYVPSSFNLVTKEENEEDTDDSTKDSATTGASTTTTTEKKTSNTTSVKTTKAPSVNQKVTSKNASVSARKLDTNYKTDAGYGNDIFLIVALFSGVVAVALFIAYRKWYKVEK